MEAERQLQCWKCGAPLVETPLPLSRYATCRQCSADLYVCRLCLHYDPRWNNACREERAEAPRSKETANFCDWFVPKAGAHRPTGDKNDEARAALDALFGGTASAPASMSDAESALASLFKPDPSKKG